MILRPRAGATAAAVLLAGQAVAAPEAKLPGWPIIVALSGPETQDGASASRSEAADTAATPPFASWLAGTPSIRRFGTPANGDWSAVLKAAEASDARQIFLPAGDYPAKLSHYAVINKTYVGPGRLVLNGVRQAPYRSSITNFVADVSDDRLKAFNAPDWDGKPPGSAAYAFVGSGATGTPVNTYKNFPQLSMSFRIFDNVAGFNVSPADHAKGRSGLFVDHVRMYQGGQGDLTSRSTFASVYVTKPGITHFLAGPEIAIENGNIGAEAGARGAYLQKQEYIFSDKPGTSVAAINSVMNYHRSTDADGLHQVWGHDRVQSAGPVPIDFAYSLAGPIRRGIDMTPADFGTDQAAVVMGAGQRQYWNAGRTVDTLGASFVTNDLRKTYSYYDARTRALVDVVDGNSVFERSSSLNVSNAPMIIGIRSAAPTLPPNTWSVYWKDNKTAVLTMKSSDGVQRYGVIPMSTTPP